MLSKPIEYKKRETEAVKRFRSLLKKKKGFISLKPKSTTHILRKRKKKNKLDLRIFNNVISVDKEKMIAEVEGSTSFYKLAKETLKVDLVPTVVPELRAITIGGTISGLGIEASSFRYGLVHETVSEITLLTGKGDVIECSKNNNADIFHTLPNAFGTLGYVLKCKVELRKTKKFIKVETLTYNDSKTYFSKLKKITQNFKYDFIDGVIYSAIKHVIITGRFVDKLSPSQSTLDPYENVYYKYVESTAPNIFYMGTWEFLWRWDVDAFWGTEYYWGLKNLLQNRFLRTTIFKPILRSDRLLKIKKIRDRVLEKVSTIPLIHTAKYEELIQDAGLPITKGSDFMEWYINNINIYPIWVCPVRNTSRQDTYPLYSLPTNEIIDIGFYTKKRLGPSMSPHHYNKKLEKEIAKLKSVKGLYSANSYSEKDFWKHYDKKRYFEVKNKYDPNGVFPDLYQKITN